MSKFHHDTFSRRSDRSPSGFRAYIDTCFSQILLLLTIPGAESQGQEELDLPHGKLVSELVPHLLPVGRQNRMIWWEEGLRAKNCLAQTWTKAGGAGMLASHFQDWLA